MDILYNYNNGEANCIIEEHNIIGVGNAICHPEDSDVASEKTGLYIAELRATIHFLQNKKATKLKPALTALKHLYATMNHSKQFNFHSYEAKRIRKEIKNLEKEINQINCSIALIHNRLKEYINDKDKMAKWYRNKNKEKINNGITNL